MIDQKHYTPSDVPAQITYFDSTVVQLGVGKSGKVGLLDIELQKNSQGKTVITKQFSQVPLQIQRALYLEKTLPDMAYLYIVSPSGGILQGDRYRTDISLKSNAVAHITTQGATRIYSMNSNSASQIFNITLDDGCYLEYIPDQIIPYKDSKYYQKVELNIHDTATIVYSEVLTAGRIAMGESFQYDICYFRIRCINQEKQLRFFENSKITPKMQRPNIFGILDKYEVVGTVYIVTKKENIDTLENTIYKHIPKKNNTTFGTSILPDDSGIIVRVLSKKTKDVFDMIYDIVNITRKKVLGAEFSSIQKY